MGVESGDETDGLDRKGYFVCKQCNVVTLQKTLSTTPLQILDFMQGFLGFDHRVGYPLLLLCNTKVPNYRKNKAFKDLAHYSEWLKVADAVIEAESVYEHLSGFWEVVSSARRSSTNSQESPVITSCNQASHRPRSIPLTH